MNTEKAKIIEALADIFLTDVLKVESWRFEEGKELSKEEKIEQLRREGILAEQRHSKIMEIIGGASLDADDIVWLLTSLEHKAVGEIGNMALLPQARSPDLLKKRLPEFLIESANKTYRSRKAIDSANQRDSRKSVAKEAWDTWKGSNEEFIEFVISNIKRKKKKGDTEAASYSDRQVRRWIAGWKGLDVK